MPRYGFNPADVNAKGANVGWIESNIMDQMEIGAVLQPSLLLFQEKIGRDGSRGAQFPIRSIISVRSTVRYLFNSVVHLLQVRVL